MSDYRRLERINPSLDPSRHDIQDASRAGEKLVKRFLLAFWESTLHVLSVFLCGENEDEAPNKLLNLLNISDGSKELAIKRNAVASSLDGLQIAARLCIRLGLQSKCEPVYELLSLCCSYGSDKIKSRNGKHPKKTGASMLHMFGGKSALRLHVSHVLSMEVLLTNSLEIGSHSSGCWKHVFSCCEYIINLEHSIFGYRNQKP